MQRPRAVDDAYLVKKYLGFAFQAVRFPIFQYEPGRYFDAIRRNRGDEIESEMFAYEVVLQNEARTPSFLFVTFGRIELHQDDVETFMHSRFLIGTFHRLRRNPSESVLRMKAPNLRAVSRHMLETVLPSKLRALF